MFADNQPEPAAGSAGTAEASTTDTAGEAAPPFESIDEARAVARSCVRCDLSRTRRQVVFGTGRASAPLALIGEGPSETDDRSGLPFSGPSGHLLDRWLAYLDLTRADVWLSNTVRCRPAALENGRLRNRPPRAAELTACRLWLETELTLVQPRLILGLGGTAGKALLGKEFRITQDRGRWREGPHGIPTHVTFHPAYILRLEGDQQAEAEALTRLDLDAVRERLHPG